VAFEGFLPRKGAGRRRRLAELAADPRTLVLFVAPHRAAADLGDLADALGPQRPAALARELTKLHEEVRHGTLAELAEGAAAGVRGEVTLVVAGAPAAAPAPASDPELADRVRALIAAGRPKKDAIAEVAAASGVPKRRVYQAVVDAGASDR
jgi:16S rRNA (cytidine1402-2'-O)-methyltransferase